MARHEIYTRSGTFRDPTASTAIDHVTRWEKRKNKKEKRSPAQNKELGKLNADTTIIIPTNDKKAGRKTTEITQQINTEWEAINNDNFRKR